MASSSLMMSSAGKDDRLRTKLQAGAEGGKTHINVGALNFSSQKDSKQLAQSSNLDETEEDESESLSVSQSDTKFNA